MQGIQLFLIESRLILSFNEYSGNLLKESYGEEAKCSRKSPETVIPFRHYACLLTEISTISFLMLKQTGPRE